MAIAEVIERGLMYFFFMHDMIPRDVISMTWRAESFFRENNRNGVKKCKEYSRRFYDSADLILCIRAH